ncbi:hypothetical protein BpHYR1_025266 [Brachionus plicatilis]|uniref:Uncharacterized protein n=1 Tax=Brachionus plicatilis TaxID=10195 RepID=A0A3M7SPN8_BRAPC|nr:hypothetical protein BpHYR1_025266 [Brachionus plicatilis]
MDFTQLQAPECSSLKQDSQLVEHKRKFVVQYRRITLKETNSINNKFSSSSKILSLNKTTQNNNLIEGII